MSEQTKAKTETKAVDTQRIITVVTTRGEKKKLSVPNGILWGELKKTLKSENYSLDSMKCVESIKRHTLEHDQAEVPDGDFNLFLMPYKSKGGAGLTRSEINATIKGFIANDAKAKSFFTVDGKNYTQVASDKLEKLIEKYQKKNGNAPVGNVADVVDSVKKDKQKKEKAPAKKGKGKKVELSDEDAELLAQAKANKEKDAKEKIDKEESKKLDDELKDLAKGFPDVRL